MQFEVNMFIEILKMKPKENEKSQYYHESDNNYDLFAIRICWDTKLHQQIEGHLPLEISCFTKFKLGRGAIVTATPSSIYYCPR